MKKVLSAAVMVVLLIVATGCDEDPFNPDPGWNNASIGGVDLMWRVDSGSDLIMQMTASTTGWVAVGFDSGYHMENANIIIGYFDSGVTHTRDDYGTAENVHQSDVALGGVDNVSDSDGSESGGETTVIFTIPLDSGDLWDKKLEQGQSYQVVVMYGEDGADDFTSDYQSIANGNITI
jgi:hypothetical protein